MAPIIKSVSIAGVTGSLGAPVFKKLLESGFNVTVLARKQPVDLPAGAAVKIVDFGSIESLAAALKGQDAVVDTTSVPGDTSVSKHLIDAAIAAGVYRVIPSEFSGDPHNPALRALPPFVNKAEVYEYLRVKTDGSKTTWTTISNSAFLDWGMRYGILKIDLKEKKFTRLFDGNQVLEWTLLDAVATAVAGTLKKPAETENRNCYIYTVKKSQNQMFELAREAVGGDWYVEQSDAEKAFQDALLALQGGRVDFQVIGDMIRYGITSPETARLFPEEHNELLGIPGITDDELKELLKQIALQSV
ncbi:hypothetical protein BKA56DRAFT_682329 [Ilyonectria sp. MPI-CAGE-AT-0026]|nr:hypothetical protein BKA56DRAFT_682329 [Ilyonectria sp. MPI-CAGE-AT-0026]